MAVFSSKSGDWVNDLPVLDNKTARKTKNERLEDGSIGNRWYLWIVEYQMNLSWNRLFYRLESIGTSNCNLWSSVWYPTDSNSLKSWEDRLESLESWEFK